MNKPIFFSLTIVMAALSLLAACGPDGDQLAKGPAAPLTVTSGPTAIEPTAPEPTATTAPTTTPTSPPTATATVEPTPTATLAPTNTLNPTRTPEPTITATPDPETLFDQKMEEGSSYAQEGEWQKAVDAFTEALNYDPQSSRCYNYIGLCYLNLGRLSEAVENLDQAIALDPEDPEPYLNRGNAYGDLGDFDAAIADFTTGIGCAPEDTRFYFNRAIAYKAQGNLEQAIADYDQAVQIDPEFAWAYHNRANIHWQLGNLEQALNDFDRGLEYDPADSLGYLNRASLHADMGHLEQALTDLNTAIDLTAPDFITMAGDSVNTIWLDVDETISVGSGYEEKLWLRALVLRSWVRHELGQTDQALDDIELAAASNPEISEQNFNDYLATDPQSAIALYGRGRTRQKLGENDSAMADFNQALRLSENDPLRRNIYLHRGRLFLLDGQLDEAISDLEQVIAIAPDHTDARLLLGYAEGQRDNYEAATTHLLAGLNAGPPEEDRAVFAETLTGAAAMLVQNISDQQQMELVMEAYDTAATAVPEYAIEQSFHWNNLCWYGSLWGYADEVAYACERAVEMEPENGSYRDTRALARALTGDIDGALDDFQFFIDWAGDQDAPQSVIQQREGWMASLAAGENPFDEATLKALRSPDESETVPGAETSSETM